MKFSKSANPFCSHMIYFTPKTMILKHFLILIIPLFFSCFNLSAQTLKKGYWVGGITSGILGKYAAANYLGTEEDYKISISLAPEIGKMVSQKTMLGAQLGFGYETNFSSDVILLGITPFIRSYNQLNEKLFVFLEISAGPLMVHATPTTNYGGLASTIAGMDYFILKNATIGARFGPALTYYDERVSLDLGLIFGLSIVLQK